MTINKQLFEDILNGKLKGEFLLKSGVRIKSDKLTITANPYFRYHLQGPFGYTETGRVDPEKVDIKFTLVDFIPENIMEEYELDVKIPKGKQIDWDESKKQNKIILKDMPSPITYEDVCKNLSDKNSGHFYIDGLGDIEHSYTNPGLINTASSRHQLECILAKNKLATVAVYLNDGWKPSKGTSVWIIEYDCYLGYHARSIQEGSIAFNCYGLVIFKSEELAQKAIEILGEETVKLALEPLGI